MQKKAVMFRFLICFILFGGLLACKDGLESVGKKELYEGAIIKTFNLKMQLSDSAKVRIEVQAPLQLEFQNGNQQYPRGVTVEFYNAQRKKYTRLTADEGKYEKATHIYKVFGNVIVRNLEKGEQLKTDELHWSPHAQDIYTDKKVEITTPTETLYGIGMRAKQDFMSYKITNPTGKFIVKK